METSGIANIYLKSTAQFTIFCRSVEDCAKLFVNALGFIRVRRPGCFDLDGALMFGFGVHFRISESSDPESMPKRPVIYPKDNHISFQGNYGCKLSLECSSRAGGAAILLSNSHMGCRGAKHHLDTAIRTHTTKHETSYNCVSREEESQGLWGINITKDLIPITSAAIKEKLVALGPTILPFKEQHCHVINCLARKLHLAHQREPYVPKFSHAVEHFITHVGVKAMISWIERILRFRASDKELSRMMLYRFGNTRSSSVLGYVEAKGRVKMGEKVWQIAFGSGFKCTSVVWRALMDAEGCGMVNPWMTEIDEFEGDFNRTDFGGLSFAGPSFFELMPQ